MRTAVTKRGQTVIPAPIRKRYGIHEGDHLVWIDDGETIRVVPVARDPSVSCEEVGAVNAWWSASWLRGKRIAAMSDAAYLLDTSALLTLIEDEAGAARVEEVLRTHSVIIPWMSVLEVTYITQQERGVAEAERRTSKHYP